MLNNSTLISPRPLGCIHLVMRDLDVDANRVRELVEQGSLIGFNIAVKTTSRRDLRILGKSVENYKQTGKPLDLEWPEIFQSIIPHDKPFVHGLEIQRGLNCDPGHVENLIANGYMVVSRKSRPGPGGSPIVTRDSFDHFLSGRLLQ
jgi:hypothetical protein